MDARSGMSSRNDNADKNGLAGVTTPTWAPTGAPPEVLVINGRVTDIPLWRARKRRERNTGLLGTDRLAGALWIERCNWIHTFGMRYDSDVVYVNRRGLLVAVATIPRKRLGAPRFTARSAIEFEAGTVTSIGIASGALVTTITNKQSLDQSLLIENLSDYETDHHLTHRLDHIEHPLPQPRPNQRTTL